MRPISIHYQMFAIEEILGAGVTPAVSLQPVLASPFPCWSEGFDLEVKRRHHFLTVSSAVRKQAVVVVSSEGTALQAETDEERRHSKRERESRNTRCAATSCPLAIRHMGIRLSNVPEHTGSLQFL